MCNFIVETLKGPSATSIIALAELVEVVVEDLQLSATVWTETEDSPIVTISTCPYAVKSATNLSTTSTSKFIERFIIELISVF